ncbi:MAG: exodeoxyribonuclease VII large subunit [Bacillota bacterium]
MEKNPLSVTALTKYIKYKFDNDRHLKDVLVEGEISNFKRNVRGHFYFTLKDDKTSISAIMFSYKARRVQFRPEDGMNIIVRGYVSVFEVAGSYQIYVESMEKTGLGNLYQAYLQLKKDLDKKGYFDDTHKLPLPKYPKQIAVLTSGTGAAVRDVIHIINRRYPLVKILVYPTTVQGEYAVGEIVENLEAAEKNKDNDVIILGRGGGSIEDLWAFNEEKVADAIYACKVPIISAVGHETDFTISDFVADRRAPTPSGAAEIAVPDQFNLLKDISNNQERLRESLKRLLKDRKRRLSYAMERYVLKDPLRLIQPLEQKLDYFTKRLSSLHPKERLKRQSERIKDLDKQLDRAYGRNLELKTAKLDHMKEALRFNNPMRLLEEGYTLTRKNGRIIKSVESVHKGDRLQMQFKDGTLSVEVLDKEDK